MSRLLKPSLVLASQRRYCVSFSKSEPKKLNEAHKDNRLKKLETFQYSHGFKVNTNIEQFLDNFMYLDRGQHLHEDKNINVMGRVHSIREVGKKLLFLDLHQSDFRVQIKLQKEYYDGDFDIDANKIARGDIIGIIDGFPAKTKAGELSIVPSKVEILAPCLKVLPSTNLQEMSFKYRHRHVDLMISPHIRSVFKTRSKIIHSIRDFLNGKEFIEVETPTLDVGAGGANAEPFKTFHNEMALPMWLRIAPELPLKQLIIGGFDRVYELGKQFRNEGVDRTHNPEFTSCELYMAYADYTDLLDLTEELLTKVSIDAGLGHLSGPSGLLGTQGGKYIVRNNMLLCVPDFELKTKEEPDHRVINFMERPYQRLDFMASLESALGTQLPHPTELTSKDSVKFLMDQCSKVDPDTEVLNYLAPKLLDKLFSKLIEPELQDPTFIMDHPLCMSPLAKEHRSKPGLTERFELFARGMELVNAYTEQNDPEKLQMAFQQQEKGQDSEVNAKFISALEYGLPPTAGWGLGVDRLVMLLTGQPSIRDVILFPAMKPLK